MAEPDFRVVRRNLSEGLYIMLDENLGGGVSLQKNIAELPASMRAPILEARKGIERDVLLGPVLLALEKGNSLTRAAVLDGFDGSFFKGRSYARQPEAMIDVGNDREFGFLYEPGLADLEKTFAPLLEGELPPQSRRQALQLASFFRLTGRTRNPAIQLAVLRRLSDPDAGVRSAARAVISSELDTTEIEDDPRRLALVRSAIASSEEGRDAVLPLIGRNKALATRPEIRVAIRELVIHNVGLPTLLPVLKTSAVHDTEVVSLLLRDWPRLKAEERLEAIEVLLRRPALVDVGEPREPVMQVLGRAMTDPSAAVRNRTLRGINALPALWTGKGSTSLLYSALADDTPSIRRLGLTLARSRTGFWARPDAQEHLKRLLVDPDAQVRLAALATVEEHRLIQAVPGLARRVKALEADPALKPRAAALIASDGLKPEDVEADIRLGRPRLLSFSTFRQKVNPLFYQASDDGYACVNCHQNHTILRITEARSGQDQSGEALMINYNSALKVINLGEPESSLLLRKPRSPQGQGGSELSSPTGLTLVGGPRWETVDHPAYRAILDWVREASRAVRDASLAPREASRAAASPSGEETYSADSYAPDYPPALAGDGDLETIWHTEFVGATPGYPHDLVVDLGSLRTVLGLLYVPRQDSSNGRVKAFEIRVSSDGKSWGNPVAAGSWPNDSAFKYVALSVPRARYVQLRGQSEVEGRPFMSAAEVNVESAPLHDRAALRP
jgi:hypothetical protein